MVRRDGFMAMNLVVALVHLLLFPAACFHQQGSSLAPQGLFTEEKTRLGSTPPSCHSKCNECHPCLAVQVPTQPSPGGAQPGVLPMELESSPSTAVKMYSEYKPLGWKCRCRNHLFNP